MRTLIFTLLLWLATTFPMLAQNNAPVAVNDSIEVMEQVAVLIDVKANDYDPDGDQIYIASVDPLLGEAEPRDEKIWYRSWQSTGTDLVRYTIRDNQSPPLVSSFGRVNIRVLFNPDVPVAVADTFELMQLLPHSIHPLANDTDLNGDMLKINEIFSMINCSVQINPDSISVTIIPGLSGVSTFKYQVKERGTGTGYLSGRVSVRVIGIENPDMPVIRPDTAYTTGGLAAGIAVLENDTDPQGELTEINGFSQGSYGTVTQSGDSLVYLPELSFAGVDGFTYGIREKSDPSVYTAYVAVTVYVGKNPNCPIAVTDHASGITARPVTIDVLANDTDINGDSFVIKDVSGGTITAGNTIVFQSSPLAMGLDSIFYRIEESGNSLSYSEWTPVYIALAVNPDLPVAVNDTVSTHAGIPVEIRPLLNDLNNAEDTLILRFAAVVYPRQGDVSTSGDVVTFVPAYQAEGLQEITYFIRGDENSYPLASGKILVNITSQAYYDSLQVNNINAGVQANGLLFSKFRNVPGATGFSEFEPHYRFPKDALSNTIFTGRLWVGGLDAGGTLHMMGDLYSEDGMGIQAGPVSDVYDSVHYLEFGRTWKLSRQEIAHHRQNYQDPGYQPLEAILTWPGNGNPALGQAPQLAPYADLNGDGFYNCMDGDYPLIRGDQSIFFMANDDTQQGATGALPMKTEVHGMVYGFDAPADTALYNSVFVHYDIINRSANVYSNTWIGNFTDLDIGFATDDYLASDVGRGSYYGYNGTETDGNGQYFAYGDNPPAQSVTVLSGPLMDIDGLDNPDGICNGSVNGLCFGNDIIDDERMGLSTFGYFHTIIDGGYIDPPPVTEMDRYDFMTGRWNDSTRFVYGGNAHAEWGAVGPECNYMFPGSSDPLNWGTSCNEPEGGYNQGTKFWTEEETGNAPGDRRGVGAMGPFTFNPGQVQEIEIAYCTGQGNAGAGSSVQHLLRIIDSLIYKVAHGEVIIPTSELGIQPAGNVGSFSIRPNPASACITLHGLPAGQPAEYAIYSLAGNRVAEGRCMQGVAPLIDIHRLAAGMYIIRITTGKTTLSAKFIRQ